MTEPERDPWPPRDEVASILLDLYDLKIIEYHCDEHSERGRVHRVTTAHGYELALTDDEVVLVALGAHSAHFTHTLNYPASAEIVDARMAKREENKRG